LISGDVHIGALGAMHHKKYLKKSNAGCINCLITSAVVNVAPPSFAINALKINAGVNEKVDINVTAGLCKFPPANRSYYIGARNYLSVTVADDKSMMCHWNGENKKQKYHLHISGYELKGKADQQLIDEGLLLSSVGMVTRGVSSGMSLKGIFH